MNFVPHDTPSASLVRPNCRVGVHVNVSAAVLDRKLVIFAWEK